MKRILVLALLLASAPTFADGPSKEVCVDSHSRGQDARDQGKISLARKLFLTCAQSSCPTLVQGDCARFADDLTRMQPTIGFVARDSNGADLPDTTVYLDDALLKTRLDGQMHDIDPGNHTVKFVHDGKEQVQTIVVAAGEKGRSVSATFAGPAPATPPAPTPAAPTVIAEKPAPPPPPKPTTVHPRGAKVMMIVGAAAAVGGGALAVYGIGKVPSNCSIGSHECAAPPGDPVFSDAKSAMRLADIGFVAGGLGMVAVVGGTIWYFKGASTEYPDEHKDRVVTPWLGQGAGGVTLSGRF